MVVYHHHYHHPLTYLRELLHNSLQLFPVTKRKDFTANFPNSFLGTHTVIMQFSSLLLPITALVLGTTAATIPRQSDPHIVDFRTYGAPGCFAENQGVYTFEQSDENICRAFAVEPVGSIFVGDITDGCFRERFPLPVCFTMARVCM